MRRRHNETAIFIAFPGEMKLLAEQHEKPRKMLRDSDKYGSYREYLNNISKLTSHLRSVHAENVFFAVPGQLSSSSKIRDYVNAYQPPKGTQRIYWGKGHTCFSSWRNIGRYQTNGEIGGKFDWPDMVEFGIEHVLMAGERTVDDSGSQCVVKISKEMVEAGLKVRGINDCLYPSILPEKEENLDHEWQRQEKKIVDALSYQSVNISDIE